MQIPLSGIKLTGVALYFSPDPKLCALTPNGHLEMKPIGGGRINLEEESRKSSVISLGKSSLEQRSFSLVRAKCIYLYTI